MSVRAVIIPYLFQRQAVVHAHILRRGCLLPFNSKYYQIKRTI
ncbi:hypothetical protein CZ794_03970 [Psychrobacter sp. JB385]|nr:hypothetical protein CZ794_03970 [Psychrobacter sp. JB385]